MLYLSAILKVRKTWVFFFIHSHEMIDKNENKNVNVPYKLHVMHDIDHCLYFYIYTIRQKI